MLHVILPLICGALIYFLFRRSNLAIFSWFDNTLNDVVVKYMGVGLKWSLNLPSWLIYSLPDGLWAYSLSYTIISIWNNSLKPIFVIIITCSLAELFEIMQFIGLVPGTFDLIDFVLSIVAVIPAYIAVNHNKLIRRTFNEKAKT